MHFVLATFLVALSLFAFEGISFVRGNSQGDMPWQHQKIIPLLKVSGIWFALLAGVVVTATWVQRKKKQPTDGLYPRCRRSKAAWAWIVLVVLVAAYMGIYGWVCNRRHNLFNSGYDLAIKEQVLWNTLHGRFFASSVEVDNAFADHFQPIMLFLLPAYALFPSVRLLIWVQTIGLASGAIPLFILALRKLHSPVIALAISASYLLFPALGFVNRFGFHPEALAVPAFLAAFEALDREDLTAASLWLLIPLLSKENLGLTVAAFGFYALVVRRKECHPERSRRIRFGLIWMGVGLTVSVLTMFWLIPTLRGAPSDTLFRYSWLGDTPMQMLRTLITQPEEVWHKLANATRGLYLLQLMVPTGFLALLGLPEFLIAAPGLAINLLADQFFQNSIYCQYTVPILPFIFIAVVAGLERMKRFLPQWSLYVMGLSCLLLVVVPLKIDYPLGQDPVVSNPQAVYDALAVVPDRVSLVTTNAYAPHLAHREKLFVLGFPAQRDLPNDPDVVFINLYDQRFILCDGYRAYFDSLDLNRYRVIFRDRGLIVVQRDVGANEAFRDFVLNWTDCAG